MPRSICIGSVELAFYGLTSWAWGRYDDSVVHMRYVGPFTLYIWKTR